MTTVLRSLALGSIVAAFANTVALAQSVDVYASILGTWELNVAKSTYSPGPAPKSQRRTYERVEVGVKYAAITIHANGNSAPEQWTGTYDGKDFPFAGVADFDTQSVTAIDALKAQFTLKKAGKAVMSGTRVLSAGGKVMTVTIKGTNAKGEAVHNVMVFDKR